jgi:hypothetical protein
LRKEKQKNKRLAAQNANSIKTSNSQVCIECSYFKAVVISEYIESSMSYNWIKMNLVVLGLDQNEFRLCRDWIKMNPIILALDQNILGSPGIGSKRIQVLDWIKMNPRTGSEWIK